MASRARWRRLGCQNAGHRLEEIGAALKTDTAILKRPIANLLAAKQLRTEGRKRGTMYFAGVKRGGAGARNRKSKTRHDRKAKRARKGSGRRATRRAAKAKAPAAPSAAAA
jgi:hypothetical protein